MKTKQKTKGKGHGHPWIVGILGIIIAVLIFTQLPKLKIVSGFVLLLTLIHIALALLVIVSAYIISPKKLRFSLFEKKRLKKMEGKYYFGWSFGWMNMFWMMGLVFVLASVSVYIYNPSLVWLSLILFLISLNLFAGNFTLRSSKKMSFLTLPFVDLLNKDNSRVIDLGCGSGRTTLALSKVMKEGKIIGFDRFDSDYIENGGKSLIERNIKIAGITERVELVEGDATEMPFEDRTFDAAISAYMMDHLGKHKLTVLNEVYRTLKPGARFLLIVFVPGFATFSVFNVMCFSLTSRKGWEKLFNQSNFKIVDEGAINTGVYFLVEKPEA
jgi:SAM-dependent methyltransferase